jgi:hypothetical protein
LLVNVEVKKTRRNSNTLWNNTRANVYRSEDEGITPGQMCIALKTKASCNCGKYTNVVSYTTSSITIIIYNNVKPSLLLKKKKMVYCWENNIKQKNECQQMICFYFFSNLKKRQFKEHNAIILNIIHNAFNLRDTDVFMNNC